jgi:endonuclease III related protein
LFSTYFRMDAKLRKEKSNQIEDIYVLLAGRFGPQHWWPGETPFEVIVGAILTQSASWNNVEKAIVKLKQAQLLDPRAMLLQSDADLAKLIYSCGYYNMKARKLLAFVEWLSLRFDGCLEKIWEMPAGDLRRELLSIYGIGEETADSILLYAGNKTVFVIDAYTRRIADRLGLPVKGTRYSDYQVLFSTNLEADPAIFNEYHALLVALGKNLCLKNSPCCAQCCLSGLCRYAIQRRENSGQSQD